MAARWGSAELAKCADVSAELTGLTSALRPRAETGGARGKTGTAGSGTRGTNTSLLLDG